MIYLDTSVALAHLLSEDRRPPDALWQTLELLPNVLARALEPFPSPVRTLDALHLASIVFLRERGQTIELASYDSRLIAAAGSLGIGLAAV